jgi:hypothetical protein
MVFEKYKKDEEEESESEEDEYDEAYNALRTPPQLGQGAVYKYQTEAEIPLEQRKQVGFFRMLMGRHVALGNTIRKLDNPRHINSYEMAEGYMRNPLLRHRAVGIMGKTTAELQLCRSNERVGGFEREIQQSIVKREKYDITERSTQGMTEEKKKFLAGFRNKGKKKEQ